MPGRPQEYTTDAIAVRFDPGRCIHAARCLQGLPEVFDVRRRRWIAPEAATPDEIVAVVSRCPSGALTVERLDGGAGEALDAEASIAVQRDGPLYLRGAPALQDADGNAFATGPRSALCRCGGSANKPFCDNTHRTNGFRG